PASELDPGGVAAANFALDALWIMRSRRWVGRGRLGSPWRRVSRLQRLSGRRGFDQLLQLLDVDRLHQVMVEACRPRRLAILGLSVARDGDNQRVAGAGPLTQG